MSNTISNIELSVGIGATVDITPAANKAWEINMIGSDQVFLVGVPNVEFGLKKTGPPALTAIMLIDPATDPGNRNRMHKFLVTHEVYPTVFNGAAGIANIALIGKSVSWANVLTDIVALAAPGAGDSAIIDPGDGYSMAIYEFGASKFSVVDINPDIVVTASDTTGDEALILDPTNTWGHDKQLNIPVSHTAQLLVTNVNVAANNFAYSAEKKRNPVARSLDILTTDDLDVIPPGNEEWEITCIAVELLVAAGIGIAPDQKPDVSVMLACNPVPGPVDLSNLMEAGSVPAVVESLMWDQPIAIRIDHTHFLRINNVNGANNMVSVLGWRVG